MKVLLSIKPEYAEKILEGKKHYEFRRAVFKNPEVKTVVIYATKPVGKVVGEFDIAEVLSECPSDLWARTSKLAGITRRFFDQYFTGRKTAYAIKVQNVRRYRKPLELQTLLENGVPPQSFCYLHSARQ
ncbi:ASCH domain-containing protein [Myxococcus stipitatus]|uniref:ASCH domain-containing protein n=1 Tax=Myxococcus stipitatus TaxID=83455 RepID=UPI001F3D686A|nr:ASCH domain-containing protein [Myxococcus stipitatus]MCE9673826.1 ASCH domain-containing protein [Myxococcus stipitatus]